jgi:hypothetical protein
LRKPFFTTFLGDFVMAKTKITQADLRDVVFISNWNKVFQDGGHIIDVVKLCNQEPVEVFPRILKYSDVTGKASRLRANHVPLPKFPAGKRRHYVNIALCQQALAKAMGTTAKKIRQLAKKKRST